MARNHQRKQALPIKGRKPRDNTSALCLIDILIAGGWNLNTAIQAIAHTIHKQDNIAEKSARERLSKAYRNGDASKRENGSDDF